ncbi:unnamed protein product [Prorocentrum cordatum]|uniref:Anaphase-promoting complex subunit 11 n=1 Tax=Prorocentrum cordatum TaxID=2364126 RepID=A0ABN9WTE4_9DINO|nr:unnamed protein product [Polarella glacialis]
MGTKVVGVQHYGGIVSDRESVVLRRQPGDPYDSNAIQVLNIRNEQIGHVPREVAATLAPVMDQLERSGEGATLRVEGHIPRGSKNVFSMPLQLAVYSLDPQGSLAPRLRQLGDRLRSTYCAAARGSVEVFASPDASGTPVSEIDGDTWKRLHGAKKRGAAATGPSVADVVERELEAILSADGRYEDMAEASAPASLRTELYPHQRKALHWMAQQERSVTVFFWTREGAPGGGSVYRNLATNSAFREAPVLPRGGILADDMGLGKTVTVLALLLADPPARGRAGGNLVVCPLSVLFNWVEQVRMHAPSLRALVYHGPGRDRDPHSFARYDVVLTTYDTLRAEARDCSVGVGAVAWHRAVLDEAHTVKNHRTATAKAAFEIIQAERRWCLTGTPIQNSIEDVYSLARFLRLEPFDRLDWFNLGVIALFVDPDNRVIMRPLRFQDPVGLERLQILLRTWCLRRTKDMRILDPASGAPRPLLLLPEKRVEVARVPLDAADRRLYDRLLGAAGVRVRQLQSSGAAWGASELGEHFSQVLALLTRLRQLCCSPALLPEALLAELAADGGDPLRAADAAARRALGGERVEELLRGLAEAQEDDCAVCLLPGCDVATRCGHIFHRRCIEEVVLQLGSGGAAPCPLCRQAVRQKELLEKPPALEETASAAPAAAGAAKGAKVRAVVRFLTEQVVGRRDAYLQRPHKAVVFSQFTGLLDLAQADLQRAGVPLVRLDGSMGHEQRVQALQDFAHHGHVQVFLCSLRAAGTGLNLTAADHVILLDPWWNPSVEDQAIDRVHRLGQQRPVRALRFVAERSVEERMLDVHLQKRQIMEGALAKKTRAELQGMRLQMVASLFEPL